MWVYYTEFPYEGASGFTGGFTSLEVAIKNYEKEHAVDLSKTKRQKLMKTMLSMTSVIMSRVLRRWRLQNNV